MKRLWNQVVTMWQPISAWLIAGLVIAILFGFKTGSLVKGSAPAERDISNSTLQFKSIADNPINAPYKIAQYVTGKVHRSIATQRFVSGMAAAVIIILFYIIASRLFGRYATLVGTVMFASSSTLLNSGRVGTPSIMLLTIFALIVCSYAARFSVNNNRWLILTSVAVGLSLYVPGMLYFVVAGALWQFGAIKDMIKAAKPLLLVACGLIILASLAPIVLGLLSDHDLIRPYFGLPTPLPPIRTMLTSALAVPFGIFVAAPTDPMYRLGHQPILDVFAAGMFVLGCYALVKKRALDRTKLLFGILVITSIWCGLSGSAVNSLLLLPFIFLVVATGIAWFMRQWLIIFPRNPLARTMAYVLLSIGVLFSCNLQLQRYFLAWPNTPQTKAVFSQK